MNSTGRPVPRRPLTGHVPVRFDPEMIRSVKEIATRDGFTVSSWIRRQVAEAVEQKRSNMSWPPLESSRTGRQQ